MSALRSVLSVIEQGAPRYQIVVRPALCVGVPCRPSMDDQILLDLGRGLARPAYVAHTSEGLEISGLSFGGVLHDVVIPYQAILAVALPDVTLYLAHPPEPETPPRPALRLC